MHRHHSLSIATALALAALSTIGCGSSNHGGNADGGGGAAGAAGKGGAAGNDARGGNGAAGTTGGGGGAGAGGAAGTGGGPAGTGGTSTGGTGGIGGTGGMSGAGGIGGAAGSVGAGGSSGQGGAGGGALGGTGGGGSGGGGTSGTGGAAAGGTGGGGGNAAGGGGAGGASAGAGGASAGAGGTSAGTGGGAGTGGAPAPKTVFVIVMAHRSWSDVKGNASAPYINQLLSVGAHAEAYYTPPAIHPAEPNHIWMEAGDNLGITNDNDPSSNHQATTDHLVSQLTGAGISWRAYVENIDGQSCPLTTSGDYVTKHVPFVFFDDVTDRNSATSATCIQHLRPYSSLAADLVANSAARYSFIVPNVCHDMLGGQTLGSTNCPPGLSDLVKMGDDWLAANVPPILASAAYKNGGALFIVWDEGSALVGSTAADGPIGLIALSPMARAGYASNVRTDHSSLLRTIETIFGVPFLRGAQTATDLRDLFVANYF